MSVGSQRTVDISDEWYDFKEITWKIRDAFPLSEVCGRFADSPLFSFAGATWEFRMYGFRHDEDPQGGIDFALTRYSYQVTEQYVFFELFFKTASGEKYNSYTSSALFNPHPNYIHRIFNFCGKSKLMEMKNSVAPNEILTFVCHIRTKDKFFGVSRDSQTESSCDSVRNPAAFTDNKTLRDLKELFLKQEDCDVTINIKEQQFRAHKAILIARSPVFASTFRNDMKEKSTGTINIEDCDPSSFSDFLCFLYCGNVEILTVENVFSLFTAADKYDVQDLRLECLEFMKRNISVDTFCEILILALRHLESELINLTTDFFAKHWQEILVTVKWQSFVVENPVQGNEMLVKALILKNNNF